MRMPVTIKDRRFVLAFAGTFLILSSLMLFPDFAFASIADDINKWLCGVLRDCCNWIFANQINMLKSIGYDGILAAGFDSMLGTAGNTTMYSLVHGVWQVAILPIGCGVLGFVFTIKLIQISQKMDGNASLPGVKEVVFLLVFFAVFLFLIQNSFDLMASIYSITKLAIERVINMFGTGGAIDLNAVSIVTTDDDVAALVAMLIVALISWVVVLVAYIVRSFLFLGASPSSSTSMSASFSPHTLALMGTEDTRQIGIGYVKNFVAVCLAGIIILVLLISFPIILGGLNAANPGTGTPIDGIANGLTYALQYLAMCILLILSLVKSGAWARDVMGG